MLLISNNVEELGVPYPKDAVIRVNTAWVNTHDKLVEELTRLKKYKVYLDYPIGRKKPPLPQVTESQLISIMERFNNVKYFAWSNAENPHELSNLRYRLHHVFKLSHVTIVPKIETLLGVLRLKEIVEAAKTKLIMIDKEDLATAAKTPELYQHFLDHCRKEAKALGVEAIELKGVIFA